MRLEGRQGWGPMKGRGVRLRRGRMRRCSEEGCFVEGDFGDWVLMELLLGRVLHFCASFHILRSGGSTFHPT